MLAPPPPCCHPVLPSPHQLQLEGERHSSSSHKCFSYPSAWANTLKHHRYKLTLYWVSCHPTNSAEHEINPPGIAFPGKTPGVSPVTAIPGNPGTSQRPCHLRNPGRDPRPPLGWGKAGGASTTPIPPAKSSASFPPGSSSPPPALPPRLRFAPCSFPTPWALGELAHHPPGRGRGTPVAQPGGRLTGVPKISQREGIEANCKTSPRHPGWVGHALLLLSCLCTGRNPLCHAPLRLQCGLQTPARVCPAPHAARQHFLGTGGEAPWPRPGPRPMDSPCFAGKQLSTGVSICLTTTLQREQIIDAERSTSAGLVGEISPAGRILRSPHRKDWRKWVKSSSNRRFLGQHRQQAALGMNQRNPGFAGRLGAPHICTPL